MVADLEEVNVELAELEEEDELAGIVRETEKERYNVRSRRGRSLIKQTSASETQEEESESLVQEYVDRKAEWVKEEQQVRFSVDNRYSGLWPDPELDGVFSGFAWSAQYRVCCTSQYERRVLE